MLAAFHDFCYTADPTTQIDLSYLFCWIQYPAKPHLAIRNLV